MSDDLVTPEVLNRDFLKGLFEEAYMSVSIDNDGDLVIQDKYRSYVRPDQDGRLVAVFSIFGAKPNASLSDKLAYVNRVNDQVKLIRASVTENGRFYFDYYVPTEGGISKRGLVLGVRRFMSCIESAINQDTGDVVG